jgi:hypothetical protein
MTPDEQNLDMLVAELDRENRLLRSRNERLEREAKQRKPWVGLTDEEREQHRDDWRSNIHDKEFQAIEAKLREKNQ